MKTGTRKKIRVAVVFGGKSAEHEVSLRSAKNIISAIDKTKYEVVPIGIDRGGRWFLPNARHFLLQAKTPLPTEPDKSSGMLAVIAGTGERQLAPLFSKAPLRSIDIVFPVLHGPFGEDGTVQGLLKLMDVPFVGAGVLGSAVGMDKDVMKRLLREAGIPIAPFLTFVRNSKVNFNEVKKKLGLPFFVKPANLGSSVGVSKVKNQAAFRKAVREAFKFDNKILIEKYIRGREIECAVLGNEKPIVSLPGEIIPQHEFYSYEAKYLDENGAHFKIPVKLPKLIVKKIQDLSVKTFKTLCLEGMARIDFFLTPAHRLILNEVNTIPGFTNISMYPKLWEVSGISQRELVDRLIRLAQERYRKERRLQSDVNKF